MIVAFAILNGVLIGGQKVWHYRDKSRLDALTADLTKQRSIIALYEQQLSTQHTSDLAYKTAYQDYSQLIESYNAKAVQANALSDKIGGTWYIVPLPRSGAHSTLPTSKSSH